jgi:hypothetical protein
MIAVGISSKFRSFFAAGRQLIQECKTTFKEGGFRAVIRRYGWKIFAVFFVYYLVRDLTLYVFIPYMIAKWFK